MEQLSFDIYRTVTNEHNQEIAIFVHFTYHRFQYFQFFLVNFCCNQNDSTFVYNCDFVSDYICSFYHKASKLPSPILLM